MDPKMFQTYKEAQIEMDKMTPEGFSFVITDPKEFPKEISYILKKVDQSQSQPQAQVDDMKHVILDSKNTPLCLDQIYLKDWVKDINEFNRYLQSKMNIYNGNDPECKRVQPTVSGTGEGLLHELELIYENSRNLLGKYIKTDGSGSGSGSECATIYCVIHDFNHKIACFKWTIPKAFVNKITHDLIIYLYTLSYHFMYKIEDVTTTNKKPPHSRQFNRYESNGLFGIHSHYLDQLIYSNDRWCIATCRGNETTYVICTFKMIGPLSPLHFY